MIQNGPDEVREIFSLIAQKLKVSDRQFDHKSADFYHVKVIILYSLTPFS